MTMSGNPCSHEGRTIIVKKCLSRAANGTYDFQFDNIRNPEGIQNFTLKIRAFSILNQTAQRVKIWLTVNIYIYIYLYIYIYIYLSIRQHL